MTSENRNSYRVAVCAKCWHLADAHATDEDPHELGRCLIAGCGCAEYQDAAKTILHHEGEARRRADIERRLMDWMRSEDTGVSSKTIAHVLGGLAIGHHHYPLDPNDFGRCYRLLKLFPEWRPRLGEVADRYPHWRGLVDNWDEITRLFEEEKERPDGMARKTYELMCKVRP